MKVALIGASGMVGSRILAELAARGHQVTAIARDTTKIKAAAGVTPDSFLAEYGPCQFEVTVAPAPALRAADAAVIARELARAAAFRLGHRAIFSPMPVADGVGIHRHREIQPEPFTPERALIDEARVAHEPLVALTRAPLVGGMPNGVFPVTLERLPKIGVVRPLDLHPPLRFQHGE